MANILVIFASPTTYSYMQILHMNYNKCYRADEIKSRSEDEEVKDNVDDRKHLQVGI